MRFIKYFLVSVLFVMTGIVYSREMPKLKIWLLNKIQLESRERADLEIKAKEINFRIVPPGIELKGLSVAPRGELAAVLSPATVGSVGIFLSPTSLLVGRFEIGSILVDHPTVNVFIRKREKNDKPQGETQNEAFDQMLHLPIKSVALDHAEIRVRLEALDLAVQLKDFGFHAEKTYRAAKADVFAPDVMVKKTSTEGSLFSLGLATRVILERNAFEISALKVTQGTNYVIAGGVTRGEIFKGEFPFVNGRTMAHLNLKETVALAKLIAPTVKLPATTGNLDFEVVATQERGQEPKVSGDVKFQDLQVEEFKLGDIKTRLAYSAKKLTSKEVSVTSNAGNVKIEDFEMTTDKQTRFSGRAQVEKVELGQLLDNLDVHTPLKMYVGGFIPCEGTVTPVLRVECAGEVKGNDFILTTKQTKKTIAALKNFKVAANLIIDKEKITFPKALLTIGASQGTANGSVDFEKGFQFYYHTDRLDFADVENLADLKMIGGLAISGTTSGDGHTAVFDAQVSSPNFWFENYGLGSVSMGIHYLSGFLKFTDVKGQNGSTDYNGSMAILVDDEAGDHKVGIKSAVLNLPVLDLKDVQTIFARKVTLPFETSGVGSGQITANGPFSLSKLTYTLRGSAHRGVLAGESYQEAHFDLHGVNGHAYADDISIKKGDGTIRLTGDVLPTGIMNVNVKGQNLRLTDSEHARTFTPGLDGRVNMDLTLRDFILTPQTSLKGSLTQTTLNQQILDNSDFDMSFSSKNLTLNAQLFAKRLSTHLVYPFREKEPFAFKLDTTNWDFSSLLGMAGKTSAARDYEANLSAKIDLNSPEGSFWNSRGSAVISRLYIRHGQSQMKNVGPLDVQFDNGDIRVNQFKLLGDNTELALTGTKNKKENLNFNINGRVDLSLLTFLTPFLREMTGEMSVSTQIGGTVNHPDLLGSAFLKRGYFKLDALPQAFEDTHADLLFSQQRILVNRLSGHLGGGVLGATGSLTFKGLGDIPVDLSGDLTGTTLTVPEGLTTHGDFHFAISGSWFPYLLKGDYNVDSGLYTKNLDDESTDTALKRSAFLPKIILQKDFSALELDVSSHFQKGVTVKNSTMNADVKGDLNIKGDPAHSIFKGSLEAVPGGKIFFNETPFTITECKVTFNNPTENNPNLYTLATTHVRDWDITLLLQGTKTKYKLELSSSPPLPQKSIISLLALGVTEEDEVKTNQKQLFPTLSSGGSPQTIDNNANTTQITQAAGLLSQKIELRNELKRKLGINVRLSNTVDETRNLVMPTVTAEKEWTPQISTSVSRTIGDHVTKDVRTEYRLNRHFSLLGSYEGRDNDYLTAPSPTGGTSSNLPLDIFGLDLQYQVEFK